MEWLVRLRGLVEPEGGEGDSYIVLVICLSQSVVFAREMTGDRQNYRPVYDCCGDRMVSAKNRYRKVLELHLKKKVEAPSNLKKGVYRGVSAIRMHIVGARCRLRWNTKAAEHNEYFREVRLNVWMHDPTHVDGRKRVLA